MENPRKMSKTALMNEVKWSRLRIDELEGGSAGWKRLAEDRAKEIDTLKGHARRIGTQFVNVLDACRKSNKWPEATYQDIINWGRVEHLIDTWNYKNG